MKKIYNFEKYNESLVISLFLATIGGWCWYKFLKGLEKDLMTQKAQRIIIEIISENIKNLKKLKKENVAVSEFADRYFIRFNQDDLDDVRILKDTKELVLRHIKIKLNEDQYNEFMKLIDKI